MLKEEGSEEWRLLVFEGGTSSVLVITNISDGIAEVIKSRSKKEEMEFLLEMLTFSVENASAKPKQIKITDEKEEETGGGYPQTSDPGNMFG